MEDRLIMSKKELERKSLLEGFICGKLTLDAVAKYMGVSYRQGKRIWKKYKEEKDQGLIHGNRGKIPKNAYPKAFKEGVLTIYQSKYSGFGPTFAAEKLLEDDRIAVHPETLRLWLKEEGLWHKKRKRQIYRERRERRACFGELLQIDGSIHQWFSGNESYYCLLNIVDDATGICLALLDKGETTQVLLMTLKKWIEAYGIPKAVYVDLKSVYVGLKKLRLNFDEDALFHEGFSVFEQICKKLHIEIIRAYSPQAKGRVERKHAVFQDRLVKDLKLYGINTVEEANHYLDKFLIKINNKFAKPKESIPNAHREASIYGNLDQILCWNYKRQLRNDWTIRFNREYYQIKKDYEHLLKPGAFILIRRYLDGAIRFWHEVTMTELCYEKLSRKPIPPSELKDYYKPKGYDRIKQAKIAKQNSAKSPWRYNLLLSKTSKKAS